MLPPYNMLARQVATRESRDWHTSTVLTLILAASKLPLVLQQLRQLHCCHSLSIPIDPLRSNVTFLHSLPLVLEDDLQMPNYSIACLVEGLVQPAPLR
jgi:hypothetical protein